MAEDEVSVDYSKFVVTRLAGIEASLRAFHVIQLRVLGRKTGESDKFVEEYSKLRDGLFDDMFSQYPKGTSAD